MMKVVSIILLSITMISAQPTNKAKVEQPTSQMVKIENSNAVLAEAGNFHFSTEPTFWILLLLFNLIMAIAVERYIVIRRSATDEDQLVRMLKQILSKPDVNISQLSSKLKTDFGLSGRVVSEMLTGWHAGEGSMTEYAKAALLREKGLLEKRLVILSTLGNNTPFIGLLGTVIGIMKAFRDLSKVSDAGPSAIMHGLSEALIATAMGLAVAIPCVIAFNGLEKKVNDRIDAAEEAVSIVTAIRLSKN